MKKYFVLALALMAFAVAPVMADVALSGAYDYSAAWNTGDEEFASALDDLSFDVDVALDDYNSFNLQTNEWGLGDYAVTTDWGKYFGFAETGFGLSTTVGKRDFDSAEVVDFTGYEIEDLSAEVAADEAFKIAVSVQDMVDVYYAMTLNTYQDPADDAVGVRGAEYLVGAVVDFAPVAAELYYNGAGANDGVGNIFGLGVMYSAEVSDGVVANAGATFQMEKDVNEDQEMQYAVALGAEAYGAAVNLALAGMFYGDTNSDLANKDGNYALKMMTLDANYSILEWLSVNGGFAMAMGDAADDSYNGESFLGAEFGLQVMPGAVTYSLGYIVTSTDTVSDTATTTAYSPIVPYATPGNGGIYFAADLSY